MYSAAAGNPYGHPADPVIQRLTQAGAAVYGTDVHGTIILTTDGTQLTVRCSAEAIQHLSRCENV